MNNVPVNHPGTTQQGGGDVRQGKVKVDPTQSFTHFRVGNKNVKAIHAEGKVMWVGTSGGVIRYDTSNDEFKLFDAKNGLLSNGIFHVSKLQGRIAVGTYGGGLSLYDEKANQWETFNIPDGLGDAFVYDVLQAANGDVWIATWSGANRIRGGALKDRSKWDLYTVENTKGGLPNDWVYGLAEGRNGDIWLATEGGMARFAANRWENWNHAKGVGAPYELVKNDIQFKNDPSKLSAHHAKQKEEMGLQKVDVAYNPNYIVSLRVDREGIVWAGTWGGGLARYDGRQWKNYTVADDLPGNHVFMLHLDHNQQLWIGTNKGLARLKDGKFQVMTTEHGLFAENVFSMASTPEGALWVGSYGGVANIRKASLN
jgi:ligand-binding sensor domain-containing protein